MEAISLLRYHCRTQTAWPEAVWILIVPDERLWILLSSVEELLDHEVRHRFPEAGVTETSFGGANPVIEPGAVYAMTRRMAMMRLRV